MSPELIFILTLALRMAITAAFVVSASVITERSGPVIGALVATLPISAGPSYVFLALDHDAAFIAERSCEKQERPHARQSAGRLRWWPASRYRSSRRPKRDWTTA